MDSSSPTTNLPYQRLADEDSFEDIDLLQTSFRRQSYRFKRVVSLRRRRRIRVHKLRRFLRRKANGFKTGISKVLKRLKQSQAHFGDLFAGNYMFMQVNPTSIKYVFDRSCQGQHGNIASAFSLPRVPM